MCKRKRHTAQPMLVPLEPRVVPSVMGIHPHYGSAVAAHVSQMNNNSVKEANAAQRDNNKALKNLRHQEYLIHIRSLQRTPSAVPTEAQQAASSMSNFFKSLGQSL